MSKRTLKLRALVTERLTAAAEEIFMLVERTIVEYEEELCRSKEENQRTLQLLEENQRRQEEVLHRSDVQIQWSPEPSLKQEIPETPQIKEEPEEQSIKQEEEQLPQFTAVCVKSEEQRQTEHQEEEAHFSSEAHGCFYSETGEQTCNSSDYGNSEKWEPQASTSTAQMETEDEGDHYNQVQINDISPAAHNSTLFTKYKSAAETRATGTGTAQKHVCTFCRKRFTTKQGLEGHTRIHTGEKPYRCSICQKAFAVDFAFRRHMRTHTNERPFSCPICKKQFAQKNNVNIHMRTHTGVRPYSCPCCDKTFIQKCHLDDHMKTHTGEKSYSCSVCEKTFAKKRSLDHHMKIHSGETPQTRDESF